MDGNTTAVAFLLDCNETNMNACSPSGKCHLQLASENGYTTILRLLLQHPVVNVNQGDVDGQTALYVAWESDRW